MAPRSLVQALSLALPDLPTSADEADRIMYARDLWPRQHLAVRAGRPAEHRPGAIAWPRSTEQVAQLVRWAAPRGVALVPFGAGSGVCAGILPREDVLVVDMKRMGRIRSLDRDGPTAEVEAGHMGLPLEQALGRAGFTLGHFPSSILCSTVGGWVAARSAGQCSGAYGKIEDMVTAVECVAGDGEVVDLRRRTSAPDLVPLLVGSEGTLGVVTSVSLRLHPAPTDRGFGAWSFPTMEHGCEAMRAFFQAGLRPAIARLYDPFDAMLARRGGAGPRRGSAPGLGAVALRAVLARPAELNDLVSSRAATRLFGGALLIVVFEGRGDDPRQGVSNAARIAQSLRGSWEGEAPARRWLDHRYAVSYRQAPVFAGGAFVDTMEVAAPWSKLGALYDRVRRALGEHVFVMAHFSHAYPDGACIYFSFAGSADRGCVEQSGWDRACERTYDRAWTAALSAAVDAGGTLAHHHGVGRSKAPRLTAQLGSAGVDVVRALMRAFDPSGILNAGNLIPATSAQEKPARGDDARRAADDAPPTSPFVLDVSSQLARVDGAMDLPAVEHRLAQAGLTLDVRLPARAEGSSQDASSVGAWLAAGAPGARDRWLDPVDQLLAGLDATLRDGCRLSIRPAPRRAAGPDLTALFVGAHGRFGRIDRAWLRVHPRGVPRPSAPPFEHERDPRLSDGEEALLERIEHALAGEPKA